MITDFEFKQNQQWIAEFIKNHCVYYPTKPMLGKAPGSRYVSQFYLSGLTMNPEGLRKVIQSMEWILHNNVDIGNIQLCGRMWSSLPILGALNYHTGINTFMIRRERKNYGKHNIIEGTPNNKPCIIVDDLCNSTEGYYFCSEILIANKIPVHDKLLSILNKKNSIDVGFSWDKYSNHETMSIVSRDMIFDQK